MENEAVKSTDMCPCGSGKTFGECCSPILSGAEKAKTAEALMRARYTAYVVHNIDFIINTCESGEKIAEIDRKATEDWSNKSVWHGLKILRTEKGTENDDEGIVEFEATYTQKNIRDIHHEIGGFKKVNGEWLYSEGMIRPTTVVREGKKILSQAEEIGIECMSVSGDELDELVKSLPESYKGAIIDLGNDFRLNPIFEIDKAVATHNKE